MMTTKYLIVIGLVGCNLGPRVSDVPADGPPAPSSSGILPPGTVVPSIAESSELLTQIRINDGLSDAALMTSGGVVTRGTGKAGGATVRFWNFGPAPVESSFAVLAPLYVFGTRDAAGVFTPLPDHPPLIDTVCGDLRYSPVRRVIDVPVSAMYAGERITTMVALNEAIDLGLVGEPVPDGTWVNMPVVLPGTMLEIGDPTMYPPMPAKQVYGRGYLVDVFELGTSLGRQPLRNGAVTVGQASGLQSGVATGVPPVLPTTIDPQPVFQFGIPTAPPTTTLTYTPLATDVTVRLANGVAPTAINSDSDPTTGLFKRSATGAITGYYVDNVASFTINTTTNNIQLQFAEGAP